MKFYGEARFKQLTIFITWMTLLLGGLLQFADKPIASTIQLLTVVPVAAMLVTAVFWVLEVRATLYFRANRDRFPELWPSLPRDRWSFLNASNAIFLLYYASYSSWLSAAVILGSPAYVWIPAGCLGTLVAVFGIANYAKYARNGSTIIRNSPSPFRKADL